MKKKQKLSKQELNLAIIKKQGRELNLNAHKVAPASVQSSKKTYTRKRKHKNSEW